MMEAADVRVIDPNQVAREFPEQHVVIRLCLSQRITWTFVTNELTNADFADQF